MSGQILSLLAGMVRVAIPISFAALAGMLSERAGVIKHSSCQLLELPSPESWQPPNWHPY